MLEQQTDFLFNLEIKINFQIIIQFIKIFFRFRYFQPKRTEKMAKKSKKIQIPLRQKLKKIRIKKQKEKLEKLLSKISPNSSLISKEHNRARVSTLEISQLGKNVSDRFRSKIPKQCRYDFSGTKPVWSLFHPLSVIYRLERRSLSRLVIYFNFHSQAVGRDL